jgi:hypothetical protein
MGSVILMRGSENARWPILQARILLCTNAATYAAFKDSVAAKFAVPASHKGRRKDDAAADTITGIVLDAGLPAPFSPISLVGDPISVRIGPAGLAEF